MILVLKRTVSFDALGFMAISISYGSTSWPDGQ